MKIQRQNWLLTMTKLHMAVQRISLIKFSVVRFWRELRARSTFYRCVAEVL